jgi:hypothetical protein
VRLGKQIPVAAVLVVTSVILVHRCGVSACSFWIINASDVSSGIFRPALRDPVASVRERALHGLARERRRHEDICVADVVTDLIEIMTTDPNAEVRHKTAPSHGLSRWSRPPSHFACSPP